MFTPTKWDTAEQKEKFVSQFKRFVESDFAQSKFPKWFYQRLSNCFGHIAHYNQGGFYATFFESTQDKVQFLEQSLNSPCYGDPAFTYSDAERVIQDWLREGNWLEKYQDLGQREREASERATLARLKEKYEKDLTPA